MPSPLSSQYRPVLKPTMEQERRALEDPIFAKRLYGNVQNARAYEMKSAQRTADQPLSASMSPSQMAASVAQPIDAPAMPGVREAISRKQTISGARARNAREAQKAYEMAGADLGNAQQALSMGVAPKNLQQALMAQRAQESAIGGQEAQTSLAQAQAQAVPFQTLAAGIRDMGTGAGAFMQPLSAGYAARQGRLGEEARGRAITESAGIGAASDEKVAQIKATTDKEIAEINTKARKGDAVPTHSKSAAERALKNIDEQIRELRAATEWQLGPNRPPPEQMQAAEKQIADLQASANRIAAGVPLQMPDDKATMIPGLLYETPQGTAFWDGSRFIRTEG